MPKKKILIAGASGLVGFAALQHFSQLAEWKTIGISRRTPEGLEKATLLSVDLQDQARCAAVFSQMHDVTHVIYTALYEKADLVQGWRDQEQMHTNLSMLKNLFEPLHVAAKGLQQVTLLQGTKAYGMHVEPIRVPARERWPRHNHENFYFLQEDYLRGKQAGQDWGWTILRPQLIFGEAIGGNLNVLPALCAYAALRKEAGLPFSYPGGAPFVFEAVDADLLARSCEWAATTPACRNEIFNITNGDVFVWQNVWPTLAEAFGMEVGEPEPCTLGVEMPKREAEWAAIVEKYHLRSPANLHAFIGESFSAADFSMAYGAEEVGPPAIVSTIKARRAGFQDCMDTEDMLRKWIRRYQELGWIPPVGV